MRRRYFRNFILVLLLAVVAIWLALPNNPSISLGSWQRELDIHKGLDLVGGSQLTYQLSTDGYDGQEEDALSQVVEIMRLRVDALGVGETVIQTTTIDGQSAVIIELPGITDSRQARETIGSTAQLSFVGADGQGILTGADVARAGVVFNQTTNRPEVSLRLSDNGAAKFAAATEKYFGQSIYIFVDEIPISAPVVQAVITDGNAVITGVGEGLPPRAAVAEVRQLANQINSGALPVPVSLVEERTLGASLGNETVRSSILAAVIGLCGIVIFMLLNYGLFGAVASITLIIYGALMLVAIKFIPITLTLAGIAGLILSLGVTIDANILILERVRDERRAGREIRLAARSGFMRAWESIRDANVSSLLTAAILFWFGTGPIRGFALILLIGVFLGLFASVTLNRMLTQFVLTTRLAKPYHQ